MVWVLRVHNRVTTVIITITGDVGRDYLTNATAKPSQFLVPTV